ncbi:hypothetical protein [Streptomyces sp. ME18-1-4]|uniref:hypothetical protein n=1 Tax=Streptomyces sp. ME18-1-4 TaxID=3028685 RepID=UPI0039F6FAAA
MVDRFKDGLLTSTETASYLQIPQSTLTSWLKGRAAGAPLVHQVEPLRKGQPSVPFIAVAEAHVLRSLRSLGLRMSEIKEPPPPYGMPSTPLTALCRNASRRTVWTSSSNTVSEISAGPGTARLPSMRWSPAISVT